MEKKNYEWYVYTLAILIVVLLPLGLILMGDLVIKGEQAIGTVFLVKMRSIGLFWTSIRWNNVLYGLGFISLILWGLGVGLVFLNKEKDILWIIEGLLSIPTFLFLIFG